MTLPTWLAHVHWVWYLLGLLGVGIATAVGVSDPPVPRDDMPDREGNPMTLPSSSEIAKEAYTGSVIEIGKKPS